MRRPLANNSPDRPAGAVEAVHVKPRRPGRKGDLTAELWVAPSLQYLPVRVLITQGDGSFVDLMVETVEQTTPDTAPNDSVQPKL